MRIGIIGGGVVGNATARAWLEHCEEVRVYDVDPMRKTHDLADALACDLVCVCVPTPMRKKGDGIDTSFADSALRDIAVIRPSAVVALRCTVPVGWTAMAARKHNLPNLFHWPEFLTARCAIMDAMMPTRNVLGYVNRPKAEVLAQFEKIVNRWPSVPFHPMRSVESELVKLAQNAFFAVKVSFWNEVKSYADRFGNVGWQTVINAILTDGRIHPSHTQVPGPDGQTGFGGACLPKDLREFIDGMDSIGVQNGVARAAYDRNLLIDRGAK